MWFGKKAKENMQAKWFAVCAFVVMVGMNMAAVLLPLNGISTAAVSDKYANLFAPAGVTFSIWSVIYTLLFVYTVVQFGAVRKKLGVNVREELYSKITPLYIASSLVNAVWIVCWHMQWMLLTVVLMIALLVTLIKIVEHITAYTQRSALSWREYVAVRLPFTVYFGWITIATIANITTWLVSTGFTGGPLKAGVWMVALLFAGLAITPAALYKHRDAAYGMVIIWAYAGILLKHLSDSGFKGMYPSIIIVLTICLAVLITITTLVGSWKYLQKEKGL